MKTMIMNMVLVLMKIMIMSMTGGMVRARGQVYTPSIGARNRIAIRFWLRPGTGPVHRREESYDRVLMMRDPA